MTGHEQETSINETDEIASRFAFIKSNNSESHDV